MTPPRPPLPPSLRRTLLAATPAPAGVLLQLVVFTLGWQCDNGLPAPLHAVSVVSLLLAVSAAVMSWRTLQQADAAWQATSATPVANARFLALGTTVFAIICVAIVLLGWFVPALPGCQ